MLGSCFGSGRASADSFRTFSMNSSRPFPSVVETAAGFVLGDGPGRGARLAHPVTKTAINMQAIDRIYASARAERSA